MDAAQITKLNEDIDRRGQSLARLLLKRISHEIKQKFPEARTVRLVADETTGNFTVARVTGHHNQTQWRATASDTLGAQVGDVIAANLNEDANHYVVLDGARLYPVYKRGTKELKEYSVHLHRSID